MVGEQPGGTVPKAGAEKALGGGKGKLVIPENSVSSLVTCTPLTQDPAQMRILTWLIWEEAQESAFVRNAKLW